MGRTLSPALPTPTNIACQKPAKGDILMLL
jgi:hypothetical protein